MKGLKRVLGFVTAGALTVTSLPVNGIDLTANAAEKPVWMNVEETVYLVPSDAATFHDTDNDGFGEFEGWGTSLCWWANRIGYSDAMASDAAEKFFGDTGLDMNIGRYNVGGGDSVSVSPTDPVSPVDPFPKKGGGSFWHETHIVRSDSAVPGYCVDVTPLDTTPLEPASFDRVDEECGYAWNYDWDADKNQLNILKAAAEASGADFIAEAFSNSPPYFMTVSGCSSGHTTASTDNLRADSYNAFAAYMADVIVHWAEEGVIDFQSATPMNEPDTNYWGANSDKQEGCHFGGGESQSKIYVALAAELARKKEAATNTHVREVLDKLILSASDETSIDTAITNYGRLSDEAKAVVKRIDTHTYSGSDRKGLRKTAENANMNLWMSEVDGAYTAGANAGEMTAALGLAQRIILDLNGLKSTAWILWNAVDMHADEDNIWPKSKNDFTTMEDLYGAVDLNSGYWGIAFGDHNKEEIALTKKYYGYGQFTKYIRPGDTIIGTTESDNTLIAYNPKAGQIKIVAVNDSADDSVWKFDFRSFTGMGGADKIKAIRSSGSLAGGENWSEVTDAVAQVDTANKNFIAKLKANSITTYIIDGVTYDANKDDYKDETVDLDELTVISLNSDMVTGSAPWNNSDNVPAKVVDGDLSSFFDGVLNGWVQIDLGKIYRIDALGYAPRPSYTGRCQGASFYGSNDGKNWTVLYTIKEAPSAGSITGRGVNEWATDSNYYRYIKYSVPDDGSSNCNIAEIKLYGEEAELAKLIPDYKAKAETHSFVDKTAFESAVKAAEAVSGTAADAEKAAAMISVVAAYDALERVPEEQEKWNYVYNTISGVKGAELYDMDGERVQAHGGQVQKINDAKGFDFDGDGQIGDDEHEFWYWIGEDKTNDYRPCPGVRSYISQDLYNWKDVGNVLKTVPNWETFTTDPYFTALYGDLSEEDQKRVYADLWTADGASDSGCVIERPKMLYNDKTKKYVIWFHADGQTPDSSGGNYAKAKAGVAISDSAFGPFTLLGSYLLNYDPDADHGFDNEVGGHVRDMNLFKDDDGTGYVLYSSDGNQTMHIAKLNDDYTNVVQPDNDKAVQGVDFSRNFIGSSREAPAMFKYRGKYYMITSGCTGWRPNQAQYAVADSPLGPWTVVGDPCTDSAASTTYHTQSTCVFPVDAEKGQFIYMGDRWYNPEVTAGPGAGGSLRDSRYVWLPIEFQPGNKIALRRYSNWTLDELEGKGTYEVLTKLPESISSIDELPEEIEINDVDGTKKTLTVSWQSSSNSARPIGAVTFTGTVSDGSALTHTAYVIDDKLIYFFDCASEESDYVTAIQKKLGDKFRNQASDQEYAGNGAGYTGTLGVDFGTKIVDEADIWAHGYWAESKKNIEYAFDLGPGEYTVAAGFQEWWSTARATKMAVTADGTELASTTFTLASSDRNLQKDLKFTLEKPAAVKVTISKTGDPDPVLSWIAVMQDQADGDYVLPDKSALKKVITDLNALRAADFLPADWKAFQNELYASNFASAVELLSKFPVEDTELKAAENELKALYDKYTTAADGETPKKIDKTALLALIERADELKEADYTTASWKVFKEAYDKAVEVGFGMKYDQAAVNAAASALEAALDAGTGLVPVDKQALAPLLEEAAGLQKAVYTTASWQAFQTAYKAAQAAQAGANESQEAVTQAANNLRIAMDTMVTIKSRLEKGIADNKAEKAQSAYTEASWSIYESALNLAAALKSKDDLSEREVEDAIKALADAKRVLEEKKTGSSNQGSTGGDTSGTVKPSEKSEPVIICDDEIEKTYGNKAFSLGAELAAGTGTLTYKSNNESVAVVTSQGKVTIKGTGICTITISVPESAEYKAASETVTITVYPKTASVSSAKPAKGKKLTVKWKKDAKASGYEVQCALKKNFKSGLKKATIKKAGTTKTTFKGLKKGKKYYVRVRAYKEVKVNNKTRKIYGDWSKVKVSSKIK